MRVPRVAHPLPESADRPGRDGDVQYVIALDTVTGLNRSGSTYSLGRFSSQFPISMRKAFCTPTVIDTGERKVLISPGAKAVMAYDPDTGKELWRCLQRMVHGARDRCTATDWCSWSTITSDRSFGPFGRAVGATSPIVTCSGESARSSGSAVTPVGRWSFVCDQRFGCGPREFPRGDRVALRHRLGGNYSASPLHAQGRMYFFS